MNSPHLPAAIRDTQTEVAKRVCYLYGGDTARPAAESLADEYCDEAAFPLHGIEPRSPVVDADETVAFTGLPEHWPSVLRILSLTQTLQAGKILNRALLFHERFTVCVDWISQTIDTRLQRHGLVTIRHAAAPHSQDGAVRVQRLLPADRALPAVNLFETIPPGWCTDRSLVQRGIVQWAHLPRGLAHLVTAVFWDAGRFHRFVMGPSSLRSHHAGWNGNFRHSLDVAEMAQTMGERSALANVPLLIAAGLLHDAGKADEYRLNQDSNGFRLSERGELIGHRTTLNEWLAVARDGARVVMPNEVYLSLLHIINAANAPRWVGLRSPRCVEAEILSMVDRLSGHEELHERCAPEDGSHGFGGYHSQFGHRTYVTPRVGV